MLGALRTEQHQTLGVSSDWMHISDESGTSPNIPPQGQSEASMKKQPHAHQVCLHPKDVGLWLGDGTGVGM